MVGGEGWQLARHHDVGDAEQQVPAQRAAGMQCGEVLSLEALHLEQRHGQGIAQRERRSRAAGGRERLRAGFLRDARIERHVGLTGERRLEISRDRDEGDAEPLELVD